MITLAKAKRTKNKNNAIELAKEIPTSVISVNRTYELNLDILDPKTLDQLYATVPEISRAVDLRGAAVISKGFEIKAVDESEEAKKYAAECLRIINNSGGVSFIKQWQKNADLYGNGYTELVDEGSGDTLSNVTHLAHVHPFNFGYKLEEYDDEGTPRTRVKLDSETQMPEAYAIYQYNDIKSIYENKTEIPLFKIAHLKYKVIGDALYGISMVQPMYGSVLRKLKIEDSIESAARLVSAPKIVIRGEFPTEEAARQEAREAASLDVNDVVVLNNGEDFKFVTPGDTNLPQLREIFITNITAATGIPRPLLTSEGNDINKATMTELIGQLRENMKADMNEIKRVIESDVFPRIAQANGINNWEGIVPEFIFPDDKDTENDRIVREEKKAATLTSLSNSVMIISNMLTAETGVGSDTRGLMEEAMRKTLEIYNKTIETFIVNNDQEKQKIEEVLVDPKDKRDLTLNYENNPYFSETVEIQENYDESEMYSQVTLIDEIDQSRQPEVMIIRHHLMHHLYDAISNGAYIVDIETGLDITLPAIVKKHRQYLDIMTELGMVHEPYEIGSELDQL